MIFTSLYSFLKEEAFIDEHAETETLITKFIEARNKKDDGLIWFASSNLLYITISLKNTAGLMGAVANLANRRLTTQRKTDFKPRMSISHFLAKKEQEENMKQ